MNIVAIVQARMGSTRLPGKVLLDLGDKKVLNHVFDRLQMCETLTHTILATTTNKNDDALVDWAIENNVLYHRGSEEDVLSRYYETAKKFNADVIVRITSDCPFIDFEVVDKVVEAHIKSDCDYTSNVHPPTYPDGLDTEVFTFKSIETANKKARSQKDREHVTPFIWNKENNFKVQNVKNKEDNSKLRLTLDNIDDYEFLKLIINNLKTENFTLRNIISFVKDNQDTLLLNQHHKRNENF